MWQEWNSAETSVSAISVNLCINCSACFFFCVCIVYNDLPSFCFIVRDVCINCVCACWSMHLEDTYRAFSVNILKWLQCLDILTVWYLLWTWFSLGASSILQSTAMSVSAVFGKKRMFTLANSLALMKSTRPRGVFCKSPLSGQPVSANTYWIELDRWQSDVTHNQCSRAPSNQRVVKRTVLLVESCRIPALD